MQTFILQCIIFFQNDLDAYPEDRIKINTAISYFDSIALDWIAPFMLAEPRPEMLEDWDSFVRCLLDMFGDRDIMLVAQGKIKKIKMEDNHRAPKYIIEFAQWAPLTGYNEFALAERFYDGLPERLKDKICDVGRPTDFVSLRTLAKQLDARYWERQDEKGAVRSTTTKSDAPKAKDSKSSQPPTNNSTNPPKSSEAKAKPKLPLNSAGRLNDEERRRRMENKLCLYCASPDHIRANCPSAPPMPNASKASSETSKTTTTSQTTTATPRVGRVVVTVPAEPSATITTVEEEPEATSENK